jgi:predicted outer membrane repeat protein
MNGVKNVSIIGGSLIECDTGGDTDENGGALYLKDVKSEVSISGTSFIRNRCYSGGCFIINTAIRFFHCKFSENIATYDGSCIYWDGKLYITILHSYFDMNSAERYGGALYCSNTSYVNGLIELCVFKKNEAKDGTDIYVCKTGTDTLSQHLKASRSSSKGNRVKSGGTISDGATVLPVVQTQIYINGSEGIDDVLCGGEDVYNAVVDSSDGKPCKSV